MWARVETVLRVVRRISGMPDYAAYVEHAKRRHPERALASEREFYEEYLRARYEGGPTRCC
jgi:uncharacterized short protein YbdD (DUF466 family)